MFCATLSHIAQICVSRVNVCRCKHYTAHKVAFETGVSCTLEMLSLYGTACQCSTQEQQSSHLYETCSWGAGVAWTLRSSQELKFVLDSCWQVFPVIGTPHFSIHLLGWISTFWQLHHKPMGFFGYICINMEIYVNTHPAYPFLCFQLKESSKL